MGCEASLMRDNQTSPARILKSSNQDSLQNEVQRVIEQSSKIDQCGTMQKLIEKNCDVDQQHLVQQSLVERGLQFHDQLISDQNQEFDLTKYGKLSQQQQPSSDCFSKVQQNEHFDNSFVFSEKIVPSQDSQLQDLEYELQQQQQENDIFETEQDDDDDEIKVIKKDQRSNMKPNDQSHKAIEPRDFCIKNFQISPIPVSQKKLDMKTTQKNISVNQFQNQKHIVLDLKAKEAKKELGAKTAQKLTFPKIIQSQYPKIAQIKFDDHENSFESANRKNQKDFNNQNLQTPSFQNTKTPKMNCFTPVTASMENIQGTKKNVFKLKNSSRFLEKKREQLTNFNQFIQVSSNKVLPKSSLLQSKHIELFSSGGSFKVKNQIFEEYQKYDLIEKYKMTSSYVKVKDDQIIQ